MINWYINKVFALGDWIGQDVRRIHIMVAIFDLVGIWAAWMFVTATITALRAPEVQPEILTILRGKNTWMLAGLCIPLAHFSGTTYGKRLIKPYATSFSVAFLVISIGGAVLGIVITDYARTQAVLAGYRSCDLSLIEDFKRENETLVAPGVLCPPSSLRSTPYPPPE